MSERQQSLWCQESLKGRGTWDNPTLLKKDLAFDIRGQDGRRLWGVTTISGGGEKTDEPFIGELTGKDNRSFAFADVCGLRAQRCRTPIARFAKLSRSAITVMM